MLIDKLELPALVLWQGKSELFPACGECYDRVIACNLCAQRVNFYIPAIVLLVYARAAGDRTCLTFMTHEGLFLRYFSTQETYAVIDLVV